MRATVWASWLAPLFVAWFAASARAAAGGGVPANPYLTDGNVTCPSHFTTEGFVPCSGHGHCTASGECACAYGYASNDCSYALRSRHTAFTLSFLLGNWGAGLLYLGLVGAGLVKLVAVAALMAAPCVPMCCMCVTTDSQRLQLLYRLVVGLRYAWENVRTGACEITGQRSVVGTVAIFVWWYHTWALIIAPTTPLVDAYGLAMLNDL